MAASRALLPSPQVSPASARVRLAAAVPSSLTLAARGGAGAGARLRVRCAILSSPAPVAPTESRPVRRISPSAPDGALRPKPAVLVAEKLSEAGLAVLRQFADVECAYGMSPAELLAKAAQFDALIVRSGTKVTREVLEAGQGRLRVVGRAGVGIDNVDLQAATEVGCLVVNAPTANTIAAAEHGIALLASMARNVSQADAALKAGKWQRNKYVGVSLVGKTLAVMGFGKVGSEVARRAKGLGMHVIAHDPYAPADRARALGVELVSFDEAIARADFISLHMPLIPTTSKIFNDESFAKMKTGVRIINVARGGVIDEDALVRALDSGKVAQAALDVFTVEPPPKDSKLVLHENVTVTPHLGASTVEAQEGVAIEIAEAVVGALRGELAATAVNAPMVPAEILSELAPYVSLAEKLGRLAVQLVAGESGIKGVKVVYTTARGPGVQHVREPGERGLHGQAARPPPHGGARGARQPRGGGAAGVRPGSPLARAVQVRGCHQRRRGRHRPGGPGQVRRASPHPRGALRGGRQPGGQPDPVPPDRPARDDRQGRQHTRRHEREHQLHERRTDVQGQAGDHGHWR
uniref:phosphoglycerate dehydrogenase n=1 Tax=Zea mays TaxID=4577 RepID=A0A804LW20_MAIZE